MAQIDFYADDFGVTNLNGSGLGFYGDSFGDSVDVGEYQDATFITDGNGLVEGPQVNNIKWTHANSGSINGLASVALNKIPNYLATLNIRFTHSTSVKTQNVKLRIYDRSSINNAASGVTTKVAEIIHPDTVQNANGSGDTSWVEPAGSSVVMTLAPSPGLSGLYAGDGSNSTYEGTRHDWYAAISATPTSIGSKTQYALYVELEYL
jgi:hypothetical protein